ncbi:MAG: tetratricopeptide repeat protein [Selenomonadaceae bacterium]|nr:tetratricopeptide repeat protein [Selenomonadaceae bacterium]
MTNDEIITVTNNIVDVLDVRCKPTIITVGNLQLIQYIASVEVSIDTDGISDWLKKHEEERAKLKREFEILDREFLSNRKMSAGNRLYYRGRYAEAIKAGNDALRLNRGNRNALFLRGVSRVALKQYQPAVSDYDKLIASTPDNPLLYVLRGFAYRAIGERKKAQADFAKARELGFNPE